MELERSVVLRGQDSELLVSLQSFFLLVDATIPHKHQPLESS
jgi:hypothetical protein